MSHCLYSGLLLILYFYQKVQKCWIIASVSDLTIDEEDEEEIIERRRKERQALMSKLNGDKNSSTNPAMTKMFEVVSAGTDLIEDDRESEDEDNGDADSNNGYDMVSDESPGDGQQ